MRIAEFSFNTKGAGNFVLFYERIKAGGKRNKTRLPPAFCYLLS